MCKYNSEKHALAQLFYVCPNILRIQLPRVTCGSTFLPALKINLSDKKNKMLPSSMDSWCRDCFFFVLIDGQGLRTSLTLLITLPYLLKELQ